MAETIGFKIDKLNRMDKFFILSIFAFNVFKFLFPAPGQLIIRLVPLVMGVGIYGWYLLNIKLKFKIGVYISTILLASFSILASIYLFLEFGFVGLLSMENLFFLSLPMLFIAANRLSSSQNLQFVYKFFFCFLAFELLAMLGQAMKMLTGIGFNIQAEIGQNAEQENYAAMLSGSFSNANDMACLAVLISVLFLVMKEYQGYKVELGITLVFAVLIITVSRMSILLFVLSLFFFWVINSKLKLSKILTGLVLYLPLTIFSLLVIYNIIDIYSNSADVFTRIKLRIDTIFNVLEGGIATDNSMSIRYVSYLNFIDHLADLGFGTVTLRNYGVFVDHLGWQLSLLATNPHSFIVEIGYWLGWPGLLLFIMFLVSLIFFNNKKVIFLFSLVVFIVVGMVPSSIINNHLFFFVFFVIANIKSNKSAA